MTDKDFENAIKQEFSKVKADESVKAQILKGLQGDNMKNTEFTQAAENESAGRIRVSRSKSIGAVAAALLVVIGGGALLFGGFNREEIPYGSAGESVSENVAESVPESVEQDVADEDAESAEGKIPETEKAATTTTTVVSGKFTTQQVIEELPDEEDKAVTTQPDVIHLPNISVDTSGTVTDTQIDVPEQPTVAIVTLDGDMVYELKLEETCQMLKNTLSKTAENGEKRMLIDPDKQALYRVDFGDEVYSIYDDDNCNFSKGNEGYQITDKQVEVILEVLTYCVDVETRLYGE